jgi:hypothetical protein
MAMTPRAVIEAIERDIFMPAGPGDAFSGWGILGVPFQSGHVLALRRHVGSSLGPAYTSIWHRDPAGRWTFYATTAPDCSCARYYGARIDRNVVAPIDLEWTTPWTLHARVGRTLTWHVTLHSSSMSRLFNTMTLRLPASAWRVPVVLRGVGLAADAVLGTDRILRTGRTPNGHQFVIHPRQFWLIDASAAHISGNDLGPPGSLARQATLEDMRLPQRGLFAVTSVLFERPTRGTVATRYGTPCNAKAGPKGPFKLRPTGSAVQRVTRGIR